MLNLPLHPLVVHGPIVLAWVALVTGLVVLLVQRHGWSSKRWLIAVATWGVLAVSSFVAVRTGEADEDLVEQVVAEDVIHTHKERAEVFAVSTYVAFVLSILVFAGRSDRVRLGMAGASVLAGLVSAALVVGVGHSGGSLVYEHGAASAHVQQEGPLRRSLDDPERDGTVSDERRRGYRDSEH